MRISKGVPNEEAVNVNDFSVRWYKDYNVRHDESFDSFLLNSLLFLG